MLMRFSPRLGRWIIGGLLSASMLLLAGCSAVQFTYGQGPTLAYWWLDRYADFNTEQSRRVKLALADWFAWHRRTQLAGYADALQQLQTEVQSDVTPAQVCSVYAAWQGRIERALMQAVPDAAAVALTLGPKQLAQIAKHQADQAEDAAKDYQQTDPQERLDAAVARAVKNAEMLYGQVDAAQRQLLREALTSAPLDAPRWLADRQRRRDALLGLLRQWQLQPVPVAEAQAALRHLLQASLTPTDPAERADRQRRLMASCTLSAQLHNSTSPAQRQAAANQLRGWASDLQALAGVPRPAAGAAPAPQRDARAQP